MSVAAAVAVATTTAFATNMGEMDYKLQSRAFIIIAISSGDGGKMETFYRSFGVELPHSLLLFIQQPEQQQQQQRQQSAVAVERRQATAAATASASTTPTRWF